jgi:hypothetical protein
MSTEIGVARRAFILLVVSAVAGPATAQFGDVCADLPPRITAALLILAPFEEYLHPYVFHGFRDASQAVLVSAGMTSSDACVRHYIESPEYYREVADRYCPFIFRIPSLLRKSANAAQLKATELRQGTRHSWPSAAEANRVCGGLLPSKGRTGATIAQTSPTLSVDRFPVPEKVLQDLRVPGRRETAARSSVGLRFLA